MVLDSFAMPKTKHPTDDDADVVYKDVVIVGNGPGAICLSYMLAGNWPYYTGEPHPGDEMLTARLNYVTRSSRYETELNDENVESGYEKNTRRCKIPNKSQLIGLARISRSNLATLTSGVEGRGGGKPLALLMDQLQHPCVDIGLDLPSLITWLPTEHNPEHKIIDHVVLGKGPPGGSWQSMDPNVLTISLNRWMSLPSLHLKKWVKLVEAEERRKSVILGDRGTEPCLTKKKTSSCKAASRVPVGTVAAYYEDYVRTQGLEKYFKCGRTVTSVRAIPGLSDNEEEYGWLVLGYENETGKRFVYRCKRVVLATGTTDSPNRLGLPGEESRPSWLTHDLNDLENKLDRIASEHRNCSVNDEGDNNSTELKVEPVLVVGAGLSAADAIMAARFRGIPVLHVFRDSSEDWTRQKGTNGTGHKLGSSNYDRLQWLPASIYPEYHKVYEMMADGGTNYPLYKALHGYSVVDVGASGDETFGPQERKVILCAPNGQLQTYRVSAVAILIGSRPDLSYLGEYATRLGKIVNKPIDSKSNPIETDDFTYEAIRAPRKGLYALGPLVGDNFVRFLLGGAFGILAHIVNTSGT